MGLYQAEEAKVCTPDAQHCDHNLCLATSPRGLNSTSVLPRGAAALGYLI